MKISISNIKQFLGHKNAIYRLAILNEQEFVSAGADGMLVKWNINKSEEGVMIANAEEPIYDITIYKHWILLGLKSGKIFAHNTLKHDQSRLLMVNRESIFCLAVHGTDIFSGTANGILYALNSNFEVVKKVKLGDKALRSIHIFKDKLYVGATGGNLFKVDLDFERIQENRGHNDSIFAISNNGKAIITGGKDALIKIWSPNLELLRDPIKAHLYHVKSLHLNPYKNIFSSTSMDKSIKIWDAGNMELQKVINYEKNETHSSSINCGLWFDEKTFISCSDDRKILSFELNFNPN